VIVRGRYGHVSFILDPAPVRIRVLEVVPPWPPKLVDQLRRVLDVAEDLPPVELVPELVDLRDLAARRPAARYLFPCRAGQGAPDGALPAPGGPTPPVAKVSYLDEIPPREPWTLVGCARSRAIHDWFYGDEVPQVDMCPRNLAGPDDAGGPRLTKCCLLEDRVACDGDTVIVPWGASLAQISEGLRLAVAARPVRSTGAMTDRISGLRPLPAPVGDRRGQGGARREGRLAGWLEVITALARVQAEAGLIPVRAAELIAEHARADRIDLAWRPSRPGRPRIRCWA
jgi:Adenylosuccinate lyase